MAIISFSVISERGAYISKYNLIQTNTTLTKEEKELEIEKLKIEQLHKESIYTQLLEKFKTEEMIAKIFPGEIVRCFIAEEVRSSSSIFAGFEWSYNCVASEVPFFKLN